MHCKKDKAKELITRFLTKIGINIAYSSGLKIRDFVERNTQKSSKNESSAVYRISEAQHPTTAIPHEI